MVECKKEIWSKSVAQRIFPKSPAKIDSNSVVKFGVWNQYFKLILIH